MLTECRSPSLSFSPPLSQAETGAKASGVERAAKRVARQTESRIFLSMVGSLLEGEPSVKRYPVNVGSREVETPASHREGCLF